MSFQQTRFQSGSSRHRSLPGLMSSVERGGIRGATTCERAVSAAGSRTAHGSNDRDSEAPASASRHRASIVPHDCLHARAVRAAHAGRSPAESDLPATTEMPSRNPQPDRPKSASSQARSLVDEPPSITTPPDGTRRATTPTESRQPVCHGSEYGTARVDQRSCAGVKRSTMPSEAATAGGGCQRRPVPALRG